MEQRIELDGTYMNVIKFGNGSKNLTVIAGVSLTGLEGMGETLENALSIFAKNFTVYVFDRKKVLSVGYTIEDMTDDIYRCLKIMGVEKTSVYGVSQGGMIGQVMAVNHPEMVENLALCSTICKITPELEKVIDLWIDASKAHDVERVNTLFLEYVYSQSFIDSIKDSIPELIKNGTDTDCDHFVTVLEAIKIFDISKSLDKVTCPTLILADVNDKVFTSECANEIAEKIKGSTVHLYEEYSHAVYDEAPDLKERVVEFILS